MKGYWFHCSLFTLDSHEEEEGRKREHGRQLALWLQSRLEQRGYAATEVVGEDWGWCVLCQSKPFMLWVGCGSVDAIETSLEGSKRGPTVWHCFPVAEVPLLARVFRRVDATEALERLDTDLHDILSSDSNILLVDGT